MRTLAVPALLFIGLHSRLFGLPLWFEQNKGQAHPSVQFLSRAIYLGSGRAAIHTGGDKPLVMSLIGARRDIVPEGLEPLPGITSYFIGNDPNKWHAGVQHFAKVRYRDVYPGIDLIYYGNAEGRMEYDFVVAPQADASRIHIAYNETVRLEANGDLIVGGLRQTRPKVYQNGREISAAYRVRSNNRVQVALADYDHSQSLTVDPVLVYSTYLGGPAFESGTGVQVDAKGFIYVSLFERAPSSPTLDPFQQTSGGAYSAFVAKFTPDGQSNVYYAYVGGTADTYSDALAVDPAGNAYVTGQTRTLDFPVKNAVQPQYGGGFNDSYVVKISPDGRSILYATYLGGSSDDEGWGIAVNGSGEAYIGGYTNSIDFPVARAFQPRKNNGAEGFVTHLSADGKSIISSTYLGGDLLDIVHGIAVDRDQFIYVVGYTISDDFPLKNPIQATQNNTRGSNAFVTKFTPAGDALVYSTYLGGSGGAGAFAIAVDSNGSASVCGNTGDGFPTKNAFQSTYGGGQDDIFVSRLTPDGSALVFSTYVGGSDLDFQNQSTLALDAVGNIYVTGFTYSNDFPLKNSLQTFIGATVGFKTDAFVLKFTPSGSLVYSTLIGGHGQDAGAGITVDSSNTVYLTGLTYSDDFPLMNPFQKTYGGAGDGFLLKLAPDVAPPSQFSPTPGTAQFTFVLGGSVPVAQKISIPSGGPFSITTSNAPWASASPQSGTTPGTLTISVNPAGLAPAVYSGTLQIVPPSGTPFILPVTLNVLAPAPVVTSISPLTIPLNSGATTFTVTGAGFASASVVKLQSSSELQTTFIDSGTLQFSLAKDFFTLSGAYSINVVAPQTAQSNSVLFTVGAPGIVIGAVTNAASYATGSIAPGEIISIFGTNLDQNVTFDGTPATLVYFSSTQVNVTVPYSVTGSTTRLQMPTSSVQLQVAPSAPGIFAAVSAGDGIVVLYATGCGVLTNDDLPRCALTVSAIVNSEPAQVLYAGIAPGLVQGANQINIKLPDDIRAGQITIILTAGDASSKPFSFTLP